MLGLLGVVESGGFLALLHVPHPGQPLAGQDKFGVEGNGGEEAIQSGKIHRLVGKRFRHQEGIEFVEFFVAQGVIGIHSESLFYRCSRLAAMPANTAPPNQLL